MGAGIIDVFATAGTKTKIAAICFATAKLFFFLTIFSVFVNITVVIINLVMYASFVIASAILCILELLETNSTSSS